MKLSTLLCCAFGMIAAACQPASAQTLQERVRSLEARIAQLESRLGDGSPRPGAISFAVDRYCPLTCDGEAQDVCRALRFRNGVAGRVDERGGSQYLRSIACSDPTF